MVLRSAFPNAALKVVPVANAVLISGFVDQPEHIDRIIRIAEEYYPKVINNMTVGGVPAGAVAREGDGGVADQAAPVGIRLGQDHGRQHA